MKKHEKEYLNQVAALPCATCGARPVEVHHIRTGQGMSQRAEHFLAIPLCPDCHRGPKGIHGDRTMMNIRKATELDLVAETVGKVMRRILV